MDNKDTVPRRFLVPSNKSALARARHLLMVVSAAMAALCALPLSFNQQPQAGGNCRGFSTLGVTA